MTGVPLLQAITLTLATSAAAHVVIESHAFVVALQMHSTLLARL